MPSSRLRTRFPATGPGLPTAARIALFAGLAVMATATVAVLGFVLLPVLGLAAAGWLAWQIFGDTAGTRPGPSFAAFLGIAAVAALAALLFLPLAGIAIAAFLMWQGLSLVGSWGGRPGPASGSMSASMSGRYDDARYRAPFGGRTSDGQADRGEFDRFMTDRERRARQPYDIEGTAERL